MEIKIVKEKENAFFKRKDLTVEIEHSGVSTPKTDDIVKELAAKFSVDETQVVIDYVMTKSGLSESTAKVKILNEKPPKVEKKPEEKAAEEPAAKEEPKEQPAEEKTKEEAPAEEAPKEEVVEEKKEEDVKDEAQAPEGE